MLHTQNLKLGYDAQSSIIKELSLDLPENKVIGLIGPNGCGKSTLLKGLCGLLSAQSGEVFLYNKPLTELSSNEIAKKISVLPQTQVVPEGLTVRQLVEYGRTPYLSHWGRLSEKDNNIVDEVIEEMSIHALSDKPLDSLSGGQRQRVWIAMILAQDTNIIMLDEPTTFLDISYQIELMNQMRALKEKGKSILVVLHDLNQAARYCDWLVVLRSGDVKQIGTPKQVMTEQMLAEVFEVKGKIIDDPISGSPMAVYF